MRDIPSRDSGTRRLRPAAATGRAHRRVRRLVRSCRRADGRRSEASRCWRSSAAVGVAEAIGAESAAGMLEQLRRVRGQTPGLPPAGRPPAPLAVRLSCSNGSPIAAPEVLRAGVATRLEVGPPDPSPRTRRARCVPRRRSCRPSLRGCVRAPPRAPRAGQGVRPPAAGADAVRGPRSASGSPGPFSDLVGTRRRATAAPRRGRGQVDRGDGGGEIRGPGPENGHACPRRRGTGVSPAVRGLACSSPANILRSGAGYPGPCPGPFAGEGRDRVSLAPA